MKNIRIAAAVSRSVPFETERNFDGMARLVRVARQEGAALVCFPEMNLTGYSNSPDVRHVAEQIPGPVSRRVEELARTENMVILAGMAEKDEEGRIFVSHLAVGPDGLAGVYRKLHMAPPEQAVFSPGNDIPLFHLPEMTFGIQICYDAHFPELSTLMAQKGADAIFIPHASPRGTPDDKQQSWMRHLPARAYDNSLFVTACNPTGETEKGLNFPGVALSIGPSGKVISQKLGDEESLMITDLDAEAMEQVRSHKMRFFFPNRRPGLYERAGRLPSG